MEYELFQSEGTGVIYFINRTATPLRLTEASHIKDATGRAFAIDGQTIAPNQSGRVVVPPPSSAGERLSARRPPPTDIEPRVGGVDEPGIVTRERLENREPAEDPRGFRWNGGQRATVHLEFEPARGATTQPATAPAIPITHEFTFIRNG